MRRWRRFGRIAMTLLLVTGMTGITSITSFANDQAQNESQQPVKANDQSKPEEDDEQVKPANEATPETTNDKDKNADAKIPDLITRLDATTLIQNGQTVRGANDLLGTLGSLIISLNGTQKLTLNNQVTNWSGDIGTPMKVGDTVNVVNRTLGLLELYNVSLPVTDPNMSVTQVNGGAVPSAITYDQKAGTMPAFFGQSLQLSVGTAFNYTTSDQINSVSFMIDGQQIAGDAFNTSDTSTTGSTLTVNAGKIAARNWSAIKTALDGLSPSTGHTLKVVAYHNGRPTNPWTSTTSIPLYVNPAQPTVNSVWSGQKQVSGTSSAIGASVSVTDGSNNVLGTGTVASDGSYMVTLNRAAIANETLTVTVTNQGLSASTTTTVQQNQSIQVNSPSQIAWNQQTSLPDSNAGWQLTASGSGFPATSNPADLVIDGNDVGADNPITRGTPVTAGTTTGIKYSDKTAILNGLDPQKQHTAALTVPGMHNATTGTVPLIISVPTTHSVVSGSGATAVTGTLAQVGSTVTVTDSTNHQLGTGTVASDGTYNVTLNRAAIGGETLSVKATNGSGGMSTTETVVVPLVEQLYVQAVSPLTFSPATITAGQTLTPNRAQNFTMTAVNSLNAGAGAKWTMTASLENNVLTNTLNPVDKLYQPLVFTDANGVSTRLSTSALPIFTNDMTNTAVYPTSQFQRVGFNDILSQQNNAQGVRLVVPSDSVRSQSYQGILDLNFATTPTN
ncbi:Ig-like domain-containing protein [Furfurilactobacillus sp. WILCCON 0119]